MLTAAHGSQDTDDCLFLRLCATLLEILTQQQVAREWLRHPRAHSYVFAVMFVEMFALMGKWLLPPQFHSRTGDAYQVIRACERLWAHPATQAQQLLPVRVVQSLVPGIKGRSHTEVLPEILKQQERMVKLFEH